MYPGSIGSSDAPRHPARFLRARSYQLPAGALISGTGAYDQCPPFS